jgi:hypothetical protein
LIGLIKWEFECTLFAFQDELVDRLLFIKEEGHKPRYEAHIYNLLPGFFKGVQPEFQTGTNSGTGLSGKRENAN